MGLYEFFFPHESHAESMKRISDEQTKLMKHQIKRARLLATKSSGNQNNLKQVNSRIKELENDLGFLSLIVAGIMNRLDESQVVKKEDIRSIMKEIDGIDGKTDGKLNVDVLRGISS